MPYFPEPWIIRRRDVFDQESKKDRTVFDIYSYQGKLAHPVCTCDFEQDAQRLVACVNACKGVRYPEELPKLFKMLINETGLSIDSESLINRLEIQCG
jgi:hypothetical protein